ncbi:MAG: hypothetical protein R3D59_10965 [Paracoccaceae bacterium]
MDPEEPEGRRDLSAASGQRMWIDNARGVVIVVTAADRNEGAPGWRG